MDHFQFCRCCRVMKFPGLRQLSNQSSKRLKDFAVWAQGLREIMLKWGIKIQSSFRDVSFSPTMVDWDSGSSCWTLGREAGIVDLIYRKQPYNVDRKRNASVHFLGMSEGYEKHALFSIYNYIAELKHVLWYLTIFGKHEYQHVPRTCKYLQNKSSHDIHQPFVSMIPSKKENTHNRIYGTNGIFAYMWLILVVHPGRLTSNPEITQLKRKIIFQTIIFRFHVNLRWCKCR